MLVRINYENKEVKVFEFDTSILEHSDGATETLNRGIVESKGSLVAQKKPSKSAEGVKAAKETWDWYDTEYNKIDGRKFNRVVKVENNSNYAEAS